MKAPEERAGFAPLAAELAGTTLLATLDDAQLAWVVTAATTCDLKDGEVLFREGEPASMFCLLLSGGLVVTRSLNGREQVIARYWAAGSEPAAGLPVNGPYDPAAMNEFIGELPLLTGTDRHVATAMAAGPTRVLCIDRRTFFQLLERCPQVCRVLLPVVSRRIHVHEQHIQQGATIEGLGTLAAGLAHELNNPTAAVVSAAAELRLLLIDLDERAACWGASATAAESQALTAAREQLSRARPAALPVRAEAALLTADADDDVLDWLDDHDLACAEPEVTGLVEIGVPAELLTRQLTELTERLRPEVFGLGLGYLSTALQAAELVEEIAEAGRRVESVVSSTKTYVNLDRAPVRRVDVREGLEATLAVKVSDLHGIRIHRDYANAPQIMAYPAALHQVWTQLIDNAVDAMAGGGTLRIGTRLEGRSLVVEIVDDGPGIAPDVLPRIFEPFFTTKPPGRGTGLGLSRSREIVAHLHGGSIEVSSCPGATSFTVRLPQVEEQHTPQD